MDYKIIQREILLSLWKIHILHHAAEGPVFGFWMLQELREHGYEVSPGTLYPVLKRMERSGWLRADIPAKKGSRDRRSYRLTAEGRKVLAVVQRQVNELRSEVIPRSTRKRKAGAR
ncbi:MAG: PadR family transcriptional regulator [Chthoniobacteraceae bacterium]